MEWIIDHVYWVVGIVFALIVGAEGKTLWEQIRPKGLRYTGRGVFYSVLAVVTLLSVFQLLKLSFGDNLLVKALAQIFLVTMGCISIVAAGAIYLILDLYKRIAAIETHVGLSKRQ